jgi:drug/metabolite transporter (DMT)-like permease
VGRGRRDDVATIAAYIEPGAKPAGAVADAGDVTSGAAFVALTPAMTALMGIPILGELPSAIDWMAIVVISIGVYVVSGGPLPGRIVRSQFINGN